MAALTMQDASTSGAAITYSSAAGGGDTVPYDPNGIIHFVNASAGTLTCTVVVPGTLYGQAIADIAVAVLADTNRMVKMAQGMADPATGLISLTYSGVTSLTVAAVRAPQA